MKDASDLEMEKRVYSVEWLSESSHRNNTTTTTPAPSVDLLRCRLGPTFSYGKEHNISLPSGMEKPNVATDFSEKENHIDHKIALYQAPSALHDTHGKILCISRYFICCISLFSFFM